MPWPVLIRLFIYTVIIFTVYAIPAWAGEHLNIRLLFTENHTVEWMQFALLLVSAGLCLQAGRRSPDRRAGFRVFALLLLCAAIREMDANLDALVGKRTWATLVAFALSTAGLIAWRARSTFAAQMRSLCQGTSYGLFVAGLLTVLIFSRLFGSTAFWKATLRDDYVRTMNRVSEEGNELFGYLLLLFGSVEYLAQARAHRPPPPKTSDASPSVRG